MFSDVRRSFESCVAMVAVLLCPVPAFASITGFSFLRIEGIDVTLDSRLGLLSTDTTHVINHADCLAYQGSYVNVYWTVTNSLLLSSVPYAVKLGRPGGSCDVSDLTTIDTSCREILKTGNLDGDGTEIKVTLPVDLLTGGCVTGTDQNTSLFFIDDEGSSVGGSGTIGSQSVVIQVDMEPPNAVTVNAPAEGESNLTVSWTDDDNSGESSVRYRVYWSADPLSDGNKASASSSDALTGSSYQLTDLIDDQEYYFGVVAIDPNDNESPLTASSLGTGTPIRVLDFYQVYKNAGGADPGGFCAVGRSGGSPVAVFALLALAVLAGRPLRRVRCVPAVIASPDRSR